MELHTAEEKGKQYFRIYTQYGRTDEFESEENSKRECRYLDTMDQALMVYDLILEEKSSKRKGYHIISLASSNIGSTKAQSQGQHQQNSRINGVTANTAPSSS